MSEDFEIAHAERLLMMPNNGGWELPKDSTFEFTKENGIRHKRDKKADNSRKIWTVLTFLIWYDRFFTTCSK